MKAFSPSVCKTAVYHSNQSWKTIITIDFSTFFLLNGLVGSGQDHSFKALVLFIIITNILIFDIFRKCPVVAGKSGNPNFHVLKLTNNKKSLVHSFHMARAANDGWPYSFLVFCHFSPILATKFWEYLQSLALNFPCPIRTQYSLAFCLHKKRALKWDINRISDQIYSFQSKIIRLSQTPSYVR